MASAKTFFLEIVSPERKVFGDDVEFGIFPGSEGLLGILPDHDPILSMLSPGEIKITKNSRSSYYAISGGFLEVSANKATVAADTCESAEQINKEEALAEKKAALAEVEKNKEEKENLLLAQKRLKMAEIRISVAEKAVTANQTEK